MGRLRPSTIAALLTLTSGLALLTAAGVHGRMELTVAPGRVEADQPLIAGERYELPTYVVDNGGSIDLRVTMSVSDHADGELLLPPASWFVLEPSSLEVAAGESGAVQATVSVPSDAQPGDYKVWFAFAGEPVTAQGISTAATVQVPFIFTVGQPERAVSPALPLWAWAGIGIVAGASVTFALSYLRHRRE